jgi:Zn-dependent peptidase ImmA (M78 family)
LNQRAEELAAELRRRGRLHVDDAVSMRELAKRLGVAVFEQPMRGLNGAALRSVRAILVSPSGYTPRDEFTLAHELAELHLPQSWRDSMGDAMKEAACNWIASALLLPAGPFRYWLQEVDWNLPKARRRWPNASYEVVATRAVVLVPGTSASSWVNGRRAWWRGVRPGADVRAMVRAEYQALRIAQQRGAARVERFGVKAHAWHLTAPAKSVALTICRATQNP